MYTEITIILIYLIVIVWLCYKCAKLCKISCYVYLFTRIRRILLNWYYLSVIIVIVDPITHIVFVVVAYLITNLYKHPPKYIITYTSIHPLHHQPLPLPYSPTFCSHVHTDAIQINHHICLISYIINIVYHPPLCLLWIIRPSIT